MQMTLRMCHAAQDEWGFNCGPGALCGVLDKTPDEIRPHLLDFETKYYTNPTLMLGILREMRVPFRQTFRSDEHDSCPTYPALGLVRIQWDGPWTQEGVPIAARYRKTHWIGVRTVGHRREAFDINAMSAGGWLPWATWTQQLVPWLLRACVPNASGLWWPTHVLQVTAQQSLAAQ